MTRHESRTAVFQLIYESEFNSDKTAEEIIADAVETRELKAGEYIKDTFSGTMEHIAEIDETISAFAENWKITRMSKVSKSILRLAVYEMLYTTVPPKAAINEAVELAKEFDEGSAPSFVNGILNKIAHEKGLVNKPEEAEK